MYYRLRLSRHRPLTQAANTPSRGAPARVRVDAALAAKIGRVDAKYLPMLEGMVDALLALNAGEGEAAPVDKGAP